MRILSALAAVLTLSTIAEALAQDRASRRPRRPDVTLPDGPVRQIVLSRCSACHGIDEYGYYAMDRASWNALIDRMTTVSSGAVQGTGITDSERELLLDWLVAEFGPDAEPFEREYVVRRVTDATRLSDAAAIATLGSACESCHSPLATVIGAGLDEALWRSTLTGKIATGMPLLIDEVDPLIDWILRQPPRSERTQEGNE